MHHGFFRLEADDALGILQLARYAARSPLALERLQYLHAGHAVPSGHCGPVKARGLALETFGSEPRPEQAMPGPRGLRKSQTPAAVR